MTDTEKIAALVNALKRLIDVTYTLDIEEGQHEARDARIHARAAIALTEDVDFTRSPLARQIIAASRELERP